MLSFLSDEWIAALDEAARTSASLDGVLPDLVDGSEVVVEHIVSDVPTPGHQTAEVAYHVVLGAGAARVVAGRATDPTVTFTQTYPTARAIASGATSAQAAFMAGELRLGGRVDLLLVHHAALVEIEDVFAVVRARTEW